MTDRQRTHAADCWGWGPKHYEGELAMSIDTEALKERIYALEADLDTAQHADHEETIRALVVAADRLAALEAELASMRTDRYESRATTHASVCWSWGPKHYECAVREIERLAARLTASQQQEQAEPPSAPEPEVHSYDPTDQRESVTIRWPDGKCLGYVLDRTRYTDNLPPSAHVGVDFAAVASILRRAMRDGVHYGYRREFILQQALALEALSQQPEAVDAGLAQRIQALVGGVEVDLEAPLSSSPLREQEEGK